MTLVIHTFPLIGIKFSRFVFRVYARENSERVLSGGVVAPWRWVTLGVEVCFGIIMSRVHPKDLLLRVSTPEVGMCDVNQKCRALARQNPC